MAGKPKFTVAQMCKALTETKGMVTLTAQRLGCDYTTVIAYINRHDACRKARDEAREQMGDAAELKLYSQAVNEGNTTALIFLLKTQFKKRGYVERSENLNINLTPEQWTRFEKLADQTNTPASQLFEDMMNAIAAEVSADAADGGA